VNSDLEHEKLAALQLIRSENIGVRTFFSLIEIFGNPINVLEKLPSFIKSRSGGKKIKICSKEKAQQEMEDSQKYGAKIVYYKENIYPESLKQIHDFPPIITILGNKELLLSENKISIVGSRNSSINSSRFSYKIAKEFGESGFSVVSGLARGVDAQAHMGSIDSGTIGVIAGGIDNIYPLENKKLYEYMRERGLIISENAFGVVPQAKNFPQRNRIVSGLSKALVVVEASLKSGSLITANFALEQGREVFSVPGFPMDPRYSGTNALIKQGAYLFERSDDVLNVLNERNIVQKDLLAYKCSNDIDKIGSTEKISEKDLDKTKELILSKLSVMPTSLDDLIVGSGISRKEALLCIVELELEDVVSKVGNHISLVVN
jgi:DNA processing protein